LLDVEIGNKKIIIKKASCGNRERGPWTINLSAIALKRLNIPARSELREAVRFRVLPLVSRYLEDICLGSIICPFLGITSSIYR